MHLKMKLDTYKEIQNFIFCVLELKLRYERIIAELECSINESLSSCSFFHGFSIELYLQFINQYSRRTVYGEKIPCKRRNSKLL